MNTRSELRSEALLWAVALGVLADLLVRVEGRPGLNILLWALAGVGVLGLLLRKRSNPPASETRWLVGGAVGFAAALVLRDAEALAVFSLLAAVALLLMAAGRAATAWALHSQVSDLVFAVLRVAVLCAAGPCGWGRREHGSEHGTPIFTSTWPRTALRGFVMALPALVVLTALLMSADPIFFRMIESTFPTSLETLVADLVFATVIAWLTAGFLRAFMVRDEIFAGLRPPSPAFAAAEVAVALGMLNLLFVVFMAVQLRYLFGGADLVQITPGLSYAEYARRGFFELVVTALLVVPLLMLADWAAAPAITRARKVLRASMLVLVVLLVGVLASAAYRMWLYQNAYGLTELRLYVSVVIVWLTVVFGWLVFTVLRGRRERFAFGSIVAAFACIAVLHVLNPHALIARVNLDRTVAGADYDGAYLGSLSADAVPMLLARINELSAAERCRVGTLLEQRWTGPRRGGWRTWNLGDWRARSLVAPRAGTLACAAGVN